jgi:endonuclease YncB( thermonuclease family)
MLRAVLLVLILLFVAESASARARPAAEPVAAGRVVEVVDGDTVVLEGGVEVRLVGIQAPKLPLGRPNFPVWPLAPEAKAALDRLALGKPVSLGYGGARIDRHGRLLAHLDADGAWVQGEMLRQGLARVYTFHDNRARAAEMLALEREARAAGRGIWKHPYYRVLDATETPKSFDRLLDSFQMVEGRVVKAAVVKRRGYLNFGADWRSDFTVTISAEHLRAFAAAGADVVAYEGKRVRVRGWLKSWNGPMIEATHPEQIEVLDP